MAHLIKTKRGLDIQISGKAEKVINNLRVSDVVALVPDYYHGITPKMVVKEGDIVKAGSPIFYNKSIESMNFVSPVSGKVLAVNRGERRKILSITIQRDANNEFLKFEHAALAQMSAEEVKSLLLQSGLWSYIKQRPYDVIASPAQTPKAIFVSTFDTAPLAAENDFVMQGQTLDFQTGIDALAKLTTGKVHLGLKKGSSFFASVKNAEISYFDGPHPVGNVGIQINHISPINKGQVVWTIGAQDVLFIGRLFNKNIVDLTRTVALTGPEVLKPQYFNTIVGTSIAPIVKNNISTNITLRFISGNILTGIEVEPVGYLDPYATQITVVKEGEDVHELFGWMLPRFNKFSISNTYFSKLLLKFANKKDFEYDTRLLGGQRAFIMSGEYDKVCPMDIMPEFLIKAMITANIDKMEALGAYEIAPEDVALCEFVCTSKIPVQQIVRDALDFMKKELE